MKTLQRQRHLIQTFAVAFFPLLLVGAAFCQSGPPPPPPDPFLDNYYFNNPAWLSEFGYAPIAFSTNLVSVQEWSRNALLLDTTNIVPAYLNYNIIEPSDGTTNLVFDIGAIRCVFICDWATADTNQFGEGPGDGAGDPGYLLAAGDFSSGSPDGLWAIYFDAGGTNIYFGAVSNSETTVFVSAPISWASNSIHEIGLSYSSNTVLYLDGQVAASGAPVTLVPATNVWTNGFFVGSDGYGYEQSRGIFWYLEFCDSNFFDPDWSDICNDSYFTNSWLHLSNEFASWQGAQGGFQLDAGAGVGFSLPPTPTNSINTNYASFTNFWLLFTNNGGAAQVDLINAAQGLTYVIVTNSHVEPMTSTNWKQCIRLIGSSTVMPITNLTFGSNALFANAILVWETSTNGLPDWWQEEFFGALNVNPNGNPTGDGINNLNKYLMGLNPNIAYFSPLIVIPPGGGYASIPAISIFSLDNATIKYTTDGSIPSSTHGMSILSGVPLTNLPSGSFTLTAWESGLTPNVVTSNTYTVIPVAPVFSLPGGACVSGATLSISCANSNAVVRYTTNGTNPTTNSPSIQASNVITLVTNETINAAAWFNGLVSPVSTASYIIQYPPSNDNFSNAAVLSGMPGYAQGTVVASTLEQFEITNANFQNETPNRSKLRGICPATGTTSVVDTSPFLLGCLVAECSA